MSKSYNARLATRITTSAGTRLRQLALLRRRRISHLPGEVLDAALPASEDLAAQFAHLTSTGPGAEDDNAAVLPRLGEVLREYRTANQLTQAALAELLQVDQTYVSMIERGRRQIRDVGFLLRVSRLLRIPPTDLGLSNELLGAGEAAGRGPARKTGGQQLAGAHASVESSQGEWRAIRRYLNHHRNDLARMATGLYPAEFRIKRTPLICPPSIWPTSRWRG